MNEQNSTIGKNLYSLFESTPSEAQKVFLQELFKQKGEELEDYAFYLACKEVKDRGDYLSDEEAKNFIEGLPG